MTSQFGENYIRKVYDNGLTVHFIKKSGYQETYVALTSKFGSVDQTVLRESGLVTYPAGIAHFLEHKLFEMPYSPDVLLEFSQLGVDANAYTTYDRTVYLFSTPVDVTAPLKLLLDFVLTPHFLPESIEREKGIIEQEIAMYQDDPDYRLFMGVMGNLYPGTPLAEDIAGTADSIAGVSAELLLENYHAFYAVDNLDLILVGDLDVVAIDHLLEQSLADYPKKAEAKVAIQSLVSQGVLKPGRIHLPVSQPKLALGLKGSGIPRSYTALEYKLLLRLFFSLLFSWTSETFQDWYSKGRIDYSLDIEIEVEERYQFVVISLDTKEPIAMSRAIVKKIKDFKTSLDVTSHHLEIVKKEMYGDFVKSLDHIDSLANQFIQYLYDDATYLDLGALILSADLNKVKQIGEHFVSQMQVTDFTILPK